MNNIPVEFEQHQRRFFETQLAARTVCLKQDGDTVTAPSIDEVPDYGVAIIEAATEVKRYERYGSKLYLVGATYTEVT